MPDTSDSKCTFLSHLIRGDHEVFHRGVLLFNNKHFLRGDYKVLLVQKISQHFCLKIEVIWPLYWWGKTIPAVTNDIWKEICFPDDVINMLILKIGSVSLFLLCVMSYIDETRLMNNRSRIKSSRVSYVDIANISINGSKSIKCCRSSSSVIKT